MADSGRKQQSLVWDLGSDKTGPHMATCGKCNPPRDFAYTDGTTNLRNHLRLVRGIKVDGDNGSEKKSQGIGAFFKPAMVSPARAGGTDERLVEFVARDLRLISVVCGIGFKNLLAWLEPGMLCRLRHS